MSVLRSHLDDYLELRRSLGFGLGRPGQILAGFVTYLGEAGAATVTAEHALAFATAPAGADPSWRRIRMAAVRPFARYLEPLVPGTEVPPRGMLPGPVSRRAVPYLYSGAEIASLLAAAGRFRDPFRVATWQTLIGLLASTGIFSRGTFAVARRGAGVPSESFCNTSRECGARCPRCSDVRPARTCNKCNTLRGDGGKLIKDLPA